MLCAIVQEIMANRAQVVVSNCKIIRRQEFKPLSFLQVHALSIIFKNFHLG